METEKTGLFIAGLNGEKIEVTNLNEAIIQATWCVACHEEAKKAHETNPDVYYFADAHKHWSHVLNELNKIKL